MKFNEDILAAAHHVANAVKAGNYAITVNMDIAVCSEEEAVNVSAQHILENRFPEVVMKAPGMFSVIA